MSLDPKRFALKYSPGGRVAHVALVGLFSGAWDVGLCNQPVLFGTGSQDEWDTAAALPRCKKCEKKLGLW